MCCVLMDVPDSFIYSIRENIERSRTAVRFGLILGTLGRQGNLSIFKRIKSLAEKQNKVVIPFLMAEINPKKLADIEEIEVRKSYRTYFISIMCFSDPFELSYFCRCGFKLRAPDCP